MECMICSSMIVQIKTLGLTLNDKSASKASNETRPDLKLTSYIMKSLKLLKRDLMKPTLGNF